MHIPRLATLASLAMTLVSAATASADVAAPPALAERVVLADCIVVGKVVRIEDKVIEALPPHGSGSPLPYQVAIVKVEEMIHGADKLTHLRAAFRPVDARSRYSHLQLKVGQEACFFLIRHPKESFFLAQAYYDVLNKEKNPGFAREVADVRHLAQLLADPLKGLRSARKEDRFQTAAMLLLRYRSIPNVKKVTVERQPIDARESQLILEALAEADWAQKNPRGVSQLNPVTVFSWLGLTAKDGWKQPRSLQEFQVAARAWLKTHATTHRITRVVVIPSSGR